ncbi:MAG: acetolactate synthase-1/2/3 large subunit [Desulforhopalus sp.]|jgi:acetolactate synthase-1/2/3 large subunit
MTIGEALVRYLEAKKVEVIFGIPGVHTVELYRGLSRSRIRHITSRHEQGAGFMADGYARVSGKAGVVFVITGPGVTNVLTPMAQARADSIPMLVISAVNERASLGLGLGHLHELPDQHALCALVACSSARVASSEDLLPALDQVFTDFIAKRPGPAHIEIPIDVMSDSYSTPIEPRLLSRCAHPEETEITQAARLLAACENPLILAGGGARNASMELQKLAEKLAAPVVLTTNARGLLHKHPLCVPASGSLQTIRRLMAEADGVLAVGTELGSTDYDMYRNGPLHELQGLVRIDICSQQLKRHPAEINLNGDAAALLTALNTQLSPATTERSQGAIDSASQTRRAAQEELSEECHHQLDILNTIRDTLPGSLFIGDSTQPIYAGNLYYDHDRTGGWFNSATGYGALGYAIPAAIGAACAAPDETVICITGDGGAQFSLPELMTAVQEELSIIFLVWNNGGYLEIEKAMTEAEVEVIGCDPHPPDFSSIAKACSMPFHSCANNSTAIKTVLELVASPSGPVLIEIRAFEEKGNASST